MSKDQVRVEDACKGSEINGYLSGGQTARLRS